MATITKLGQTFVQKTEATAASQNEQNAKIDEIIDIFSKEGTGNTKTIAIPLIKDSTTYKVTNIGTGLSVTNNTLNASTYSLPAATASSLGGVKIPVNSGIKNTSGSIEVDIDNSTIKINNDGQLYSTVSGGVTTAAMNTAINNAIGALDVNDTAVSGKYISKVTQTDGVISVTRADLPSVISSNLIYFTKANANDYQIAGATVQTTTFTNNIANVNINNSHKTLVLLLPTDKDSFTLRDSGSQDITGDLIFVSPIVRGGKLYNMFYFSGTTVADNYTLTKNS